MTLTSTPRSTYNGICPFAHRCSAGACTAGSTLGSHERAHAHGRCTHSNSYSYPPIVPLPNCWTEPLLPTLSLSCLLIEFRFAPSVQWELIHFFHCAMRLVVVDWEWLVPSMAMRICLTVYTIQISIKLMTYHIHECSSIPCDSIMFKKSINEQK